MAKTFSFQRGTSQVVTIDTINNLVSPLGPVLGSLPTSAAAFPGKIQNLTIDYLGDPYILVVTVGGNIEVRKYDGTNWVLSSGTYTPLSGGTQLPIALQIINDNLVAIWSESASGNSALSAVILNNTTWSGRLTSSTNASLAAHIGGATVVWKNVIWIATTAGISYFVPKQQLSVASSTGYLVGHRVEAGSGVGFVSATAVGQITVEVQSGVFPGSGNLANRDTGASTTISGVTYTNGFGVFDQGFDSVISNPLINSRVPQGSFAYWNNNLYYVRPDDSNGIKLFLLNSTWSSPPAPAAPQWNSVTTSGLTTSGIMVVGNDIGNYCLFVSKQDQLCLLHSGPAGTKLAKTTASAYPAFTDVSTDLIPSDLVTDLNLGISIYIDPRRRLNELQWFLFRDSTNNITTLLKWDGLSAFVAQTIFNTSDLLVNSVRTGDARTFTNIQPACYITGVNTLTSPSFPGRAVITYVVKDTLSRNVDILGEYSIDGDQWLPMTEGGGDDGSLALTTSPGGTTHTFYWDAFADLDGTYNQIHMRIIAKISVATDESPSTPFIAIIQEDYLRNPVNRGVSERQLSVNAPTRGYTPGEPILGGTSGATATIQTSIMTKTFSGGVGTFVAGNSFSMVSSPAGQAASGKILTVAGTVGSPILTLDIQSVTAYVPTNGTITDTTSGATANTSGGPTSADLTVTALTGEFILSETITGGVSTAAGSSNKLRQKLGISNVSGVISAGHTITSGGATATIISVTSTSLVVDKTAGTFSAGTSFTTSGAASGKINLVDSRAVVVESIPADETTSLEDFTQVTSIANRARCSLVFQGRLSTNQTKVRFLKTILHGAGTLRQFKLSAFVAGQGALNQYKTSSTYYNLSTAPLADTELLVQDLDLLNQPSSTGKKYSLVVDLELDNGDLIVCGNPYFRHE